MTNTDDKHQDETKNEDESTILNVLSTITDNLETYQGRDTFITLIHYIALIFADICSFFSNTCGHMSERFVNMYNTLENCRVMMRLFDDWNAIREFYRFHKLNQVTRKFIRINSWYLIDRTSPDCFIRSSPNSNCSFS